MKAGWQTKKLQDVVDSSCSLSYGIVQPGEDFQDGLPIVRPVDLTSKFIALSGLKRINPIFAESYKRTNLSGNEILMCVRGNTGVVSIASQELNGANVTRGIVPIRFDSKKVNHIFGFYILCSDYIQKQIKEKTYGAALMQINIRDLKNININFPEEKEQRRIVAILDKAFAGIVAAKENAEQNLKNAKEVFESYLESIFADAWLSAKIVKLEDLATDITDGDHMPPPKTKEGVPFITIGNIIKETREIDFSETFMVSNEYFNGLKYSKRPVAGDILYTVTGSFGIPVLIRESKKFCFQRHIGLIRPKEKVYSEWLCYLLMSPQVVKQANEGATGTAQRTVSLSVLRNFQVPSLSLSKQKDIAGKVSDIGKETSLFKSIYQQKLSNLEELKKSLLQQAFSGAL